MWLFIKKLSIPTFVLFMCLKVGIVHGLDYLSAQEIKELYSKYVAVNYTDEYKNRYSRIPLEKNNKSWRWEGKDVPRIIAILEFDRYVQQEKLSSKKAIAFNAIDPEWSYLPHSEIFECNYDSDPIKNDLQRLNLDEKDFDFAMLNQTLEHVYNPIQCLKNVYDHLSSGGILYLNVPANNIPHSTPFHFYTGYTPVGLAAVVKLAGFKILSMGQWGNRDYLDFINRTHSWPDYRAIKGNGTNEFDNPAITWVFAVKP
jgi:SAM-dependent methyltransferase